MRYLILLLLGLVATICGAQDTITVSDIPSLSLKETLGIDSHSLPAVLVANILIIIGFYSPILYNYAVAGKIESTFLQKKQLIAMNILMSIVATTLVLIPSLVSLLSSVGFTFDVENTKPAFVILGGSLYLAKLNQKLLSDKTIQDNDNRINL
jgi:hypothetical protein